MRRRRCHDHDGMFDRRHGSLRRPFRPYSEEWKLLLTARKRLKRRSREQKEQRVERVGRKAFRRPLASAAMTIVIESQLKALTTPFAMPATLAQPNLSRKRKE